MKPSQHRVVQAPVRIPSKLISIRAGGNVLMNPSQPSKEGPVTRVNLGRLTNGIYAFTLLYLFKNIQLPSFFDSGTPEHLQEYFSLLLPEITNFFNAFLLVAVLWILTFHCIHLTRRVNHSFLYLHLGMLMPLVLIPVTSMLADDFPADPFFSLILHLNVLVIVFFLIGEWWYISGHEEIRDRNVKDDDIRDTNRRILVLSIAATGGALLAHHGVTDTRFVYLLVLLILFIDSGITDISGKRKRAGDPSFLQKTMNSPPAAASQPGIPGYRGPVGVDMLETLMNGIFAFTMTLIVKNIPLPTAATIHDTGLFVRFFIRVFVDTIEFMIVFIILGFLWILSFQILRWIRSVDLTYVCLVFFELLCIVFIPVSSTLFTFYSDYWYTSALFGLNILLCSILLVVQWRYLNSRSYLLNPSMTVPDIPTKGTLVRERIRRLQQAMKDNPLVTLQIRLLIFPASALIWLILTFVLPDLAMLSIIGVIILMMYIS